jgi:probable selenium-dependent hydroxylase accessory protein YqeC
MYRGESNNLLSALKLTGGVVSLIGAGGKKTTMYELASLFDGRVALTSTSHMFEYDEAQVDVVTVDRNTPLKFSFDARVVAYAGLTDTPNRVGGLMPSQIETIWRKGKYDLVVIKADGARSRLIKAPADHEPLIPDFTQLVLPIISGLVIGQPLTSSIAHRVDLLTETLDLEVGDIIKPLHLAKLLSSPNGSLQGTKNIRVIPIINMVDDARIEAACIEAALIAFSLTNRFDRIILAQLKHSKVVKVIDRPTL